MHICRVFLLQTHPLGSFLNVLPKVISGILWELFWPFLLFKRIHMPLNTSGKIGTLTPCWHGHMAMSLEQFSCIHGGDKFREPDRGQREGKSLVRGLAMAGQLKKYVGVTLKLASCDLSGRLAIQVSLSKLMGC